MPTKQGDLALLNDPIAQQLLQSQIPARVAYIWTDGTPRVVPIWFHWNGQQIVVASPTDSPKVTAIRQNPKVAVTIDNNEWPHKVLLVRGTATVDIVEGLAPEYVAAAARYFGAKQGQGWAEQAKGLFPQMARVSIQPEWVGMMDFEQRLPNALERAMGI
jgi:hypothetical protein